ncbi:P-loop containing nucleoside triphosphate hydrolase protein [Annulohypoxylon maeteangense]|uniref:P-loop containing nucleoside triphosphate hydrolase protein n=1 Tax=Annulohypoxylon maeteangense TaxID=1927788 RepID=UPI002008B11E|nr:P-loop containing nucleoside triphosphate hydrolase protein [Annulohypoxylon maeteangense]KAI0879864.1 P-loop containing nucleoside triphosphate hydrolase protein [Annulohypoxylon maeteangense]
MDFSGCPSDESFGPTVQGCRDDFDFTIMFEKIFFTLIPTAVFIAICLPRATFLARKPTIVAICIYAVLQLALLVLSIVRAQIFNAFFISSSALAFVSAICMIVISHLEHSRSPRPSNLLNTYLLITTLLDVVQSRTLWLASTKDDNVKYSGVFTGSVFIKALLLILESQRKSRWIRWNAKEHSPEETSGLFGIGAFLWLNRLFLTGYRNILTLEDLYPLDQSMTSESLRIKLTESIKTLRHPGQKNGLAKALARALAVPLLLPIGPRIAMTGFQFCQPFLINTLLEYLQKPSDDASRNVGYGLIGATILIYIGIAVSGAFYWYLQERAMYMVRGALASSVYIKSTEARIAARDDSAALTLMSADVERIIKGCLNIHEFWANTIEVGLACWLLSRQIGAASVAPVIVVGFCVVLLSFLGKVTGPRQKAWMEKIQKRVGLTANVIGQMKFLKMSGLAAPIEESIQKMRVDELETGSKFRMTIIFSALIGYTPLCISPVMTFAFSSSTLGVTTIFTSVSYIILLANPLSVLFQLFPSLLAALTCLNRIQAFLEQDGRLEFREFSDQSVDEGGRKPRMAPSIQISEGSFGWDTNKLCLKKVDISIPSSALTIVVGPIASGKSTLCKTLLGETPVAHGKTTMDRRPSRIGYCDQTPYLSNATIRDNIVGFAKFDQVRYEEVIEATMLSPDLAILPRGDETKVGSSGVMLSGGQKQRVSIARALYLDSEFLIFDDVLSGLDANTEEQVYHKVFSRDGLLRLRNATVVLCTHSIKHLPSADHIIALGSDGSIIEQGPFPDLMVNNSYVQNLGINEASIDTIQSGNNLNLRPLDAKMFTSQEDLSPATVIKPNTPDIAEEQERITGDIAVYVHYFSRINKIITAAVISFGAGWGFFSNFTTIWLKFWSEDVTSAHPLRTNSFYIGIYALLQTMTLLSLFFVCIVSFRTMIVQSGATLHREALATAVNAPLGFLTTADTGAITNLFSQDMTLIDGELPQAFLNVVLQLFECLGITAVVATSSPFLAITYPFLVITIYGIQKFYLRTSRQIRLLDLEAKSPLYSLFIDTINGIATFRAFGWAQDSIALNNKYLDASQRPAYLLAMIQRWLGFILQIVVAALASVVVTLATQLHSNRAFTGASLITLMNFGNSLSFLVRMYTSLETSIGAISRLKNFGDKVQPESLEDEDLAPPVEWPIRGSIRIDGVSASYVDDHQKSFKGPTTSRNTGAKSQHFALKDLNLTIASGEKVAICGRSGSGKSSVILLLLRLLDPAASCAENIFIDDVPLHKVNRAVLRQRIITVPQEPVFLPDGTSFQANLDPFGASTGDECRAVLETVNLWDFVHGRGGLMAGMSADTLSGGQRQLFNLARAILKRRIRLKQLQSEFGEKGVEVGGILLLDEVSSSVDQDTDKAMQRITMGEFKEYTIIMVSHRLDMVFGFDTVVVMDKGSIIESGRPRAMIETDGSKLRELWIHANRGLATEKVETEKSIVPNR